VSRTLKLLYTSHPRLTDSVSLMSAPVGRHAMCFPRLLVLKVVLPSVASGTPDSVQVSIHELALAYALLAATVAGARGPAAGTLRRSPWCSR
jgi:hypothetical protein